ncbi:MAG: hypothetical protein ITG02_05580 [Patulibacter sp.]|nr:hypothetical protein [Patulibacter sp.]
MSDSPPVEATRSNRDKVRLVGAGLAATLAVLFALFNLDRVDVNWIFGTVRTPLIVLIAVVFALGLGAGLLLARRRG